MRWTVRAAFSSSVAKGQLLFGMDETRLSFALTKDSKGYPRVLVIIPAYNEQECILNTVASIKAAGYDYVVINDGSQDGTLRLCREHDVNILDLPQNLGITPQPSITSAQLNTACPVPHGFTRPSGT